MKKITVLAAVVLMGFSLNAQKTLLNFDGIDPASTQNFNSASIGTVANPLPNDPVNSTSMVFEIVDSDTQSSNFTGALLTLPETSTIEAGGFLSVLVRADAGSNPDGNMQMNAQIRATDDTNENQNRINPNTDYTKNDGSWERLIMETSTSATFTATTEFDRIVFFPNAGQTNTGITFHFDEIMQLTEDPTLSSNEFKTNGIAIYLTVDRTQLILDGDISSKEVSVYDISGRLLKTNTVDPSGTSINISDLNSGVYVLASDKGSATFMK